MSRVILIFEDSPRAKELAKEFRKAKLGAMIRNPAIWKGPRCDEKGRVIEPAEGAHGIVVPKDAPNGNRIAAFYTEAGIPVSRDMKVFNPDTAMPKAAAAAKAEAPADEGAHGDDAQDGAPVEIPADWAELKPWTRKVSLAKKINPNFEPDPQDRVASAEAVIAAELARREGADPASFRGA